MFKTAERRNNTAERLLQENLPIFKQVCLCTLEEVTRDPLGAIWMNPANYRDSVKGTSFDTDHKRESLGYKRQITREIFVEKNVRKFRLLTEEA